MILPSELKPTEAVLPVFDDHRIAMAVAPLVQVLGELKIDNGETVKKSYPGYWNDLKLAGIKSGTAGS